MDDRSDVISVRRLLKDVKSNRKVLTREVYVAGFGDPYDPTPQAATLSPSSGSENDNGLQPAGAMRWASSHEAHKSFDRLSGIDPRARTRHDLIRPLIFERIEGWLSIVEIDQLKTLRDNFFAHAGDALKHGRLQTMQPVRFDALDKAQAAIIRAERAIIDCLLNYRVARNVIPYPPLGMFSGLNVLSSSVTAEAAMQAHWEHLAEERDAWTKAICSHLA